MQTNEPRPIRKIGMSREKYNAVVKIWMENNQIEPMLPIGTMVEFPYVHGSERGKIIGICKTYLGCYLVQHPVTDYPISVEFEDVKPIE